jgi:hypothetical protein
VTVLLLHIYNIYRPVVAPFIRLIIRLFQLVFSVGTVFFSHNKSANSVFQPAYQHSRTGPSFHSLFIVVRSSATSSSKHKTAMLYAMHAACILGIITYIELYMIILHHIIPSIVFLAWLVTCHSPIQPMLSGLRACYHIHTCMMHAWTLQSTNICYCIILPLS